MAERLAKVLEKLVEEGKLQSTLTALESTSSTQKEPQPSSQRKFNAAILVFFFVWCSTHLDCLVHHLDGNYWEYS